MTIVERLIDRFNFDDESLPYSVGTSRGLARVMLEEAKKLATENPGKPCAVTEYAFKASAYYEPHDDKMMLTLTVTFNEETIIEQNGVLI